MISDLFANSFNKAIARALPSRGSVPDPISSNKTTDNPFLLSSESKISFMRDICPLKVDKFSSNDWLSPISTYIFGQKGIIGLLVEGINNPALAISKDKPKPFKAAVLPPVFGPVIATTLIFLFI